VGAKGGNAVKGKAGWRESRGVLAKPVEEQKAAEKGPEGSGEEKGEREEGSEDGEVMSEDE
jgi:hypothetical protein